MQLNDLIKKINATQAAMQGRINKDSAESMQVYVQGYCEGLDWVVGTIKKAIDAERTRQRLAKLESELAQDMEPELPELPEDFAESAGKPSMQNDVSDSDRI